MYSPKLIALLFQFWKLPPLKYDSKICLSDPQWVFLKGVGGEYLFFGQNINPQGYTIVVYQPLPLPLWVIAEIWYLA